MTKLTLEQILSIPQLSFYLESMDFSFFILKNKDFTALANVYNSEKVDALLKAQANIDFTELDVSDNGFSVLSGKSDSIMTAAYGNAMKDVLLRNQKMVSKDALILFLGSLSKKYFEEITNTEKENTTEIDYVNGDIVLKRKNELVKKTSQGPDKISIKELEESLIEGALIANKEMQEDLRKNKGMKIKGTYQGKGIHSKNEILYFDAKDLDSFCKCKKVFEKLSTEKIKELYNKKLYTYSDIMKAASNGFISTTQALLLYNEGVIKKEDLLRKVFKANDFETVLKNKNYPSEMKFLIYSMNYVGINSLKRNLKITTDREERDISKETFELCAQFYNDKKIGELLTNGVLNYDESKEFLDVLVKKQVITKEKSNYFDKLMEDFLCDELLNQVETEQLEGDGKSNHTKYKSGLTIDPKLRMDYLKSIGTVKRIKVNGEMAISDEEEKGKKKYNSLDGYELLLIPDKRVAILEKFYEVTRDKEGHMQYKTDKKGNFVPATENATYLLPIGIAKELVEKRNKKTLMESKHVHRSFHKIGWVKSVEKNMLKINPTIQFEKQNTNIWVERAKKSYNDNKKTRDE